MKFPLLLHLFILLLPVRKSVFSYRSCFVTTTIQCRIYKWHENVGNLFLIFFFLSNFFLLYCLCHIRIKEKENSLNGDIPFWSERIKKIPIDTSKRFSISRSIDPYRGCLIFLYDLTSKKISQIVNHV